MLPKGQYLSTDRDRRNINIRLEELGPSAELKLTTNELDQFIQHLMEVRIIMLPPRQR